MRLLHALRPTQTQLKVLATIIQYKDHPIIAATKLSTSSNMIAARNMLMQLELITYTDAAAALTQQGEQLAKDFNIMDDSGNLTPAGTNILDINDRQNIQPTPQDNILEPSIPTEPNLPPSPESDTPPGMESFSELFKNLLFG